MVTGSIHKNSFWMILPFVLYVVAHLRIRSISSSTVHDFAQGGVAWKVHKTPSEKYKLVRDEIRNQKGVGRTRKSGARKKDAKSGRHSRLKPSLPHEVML